VSDPDAAALEVIRGALGRIGSEGKKAEPIANEMIADARLAMAKVTELIDGCTAGSADAVELGEILKQLEHVQSRCTYDPRTQIDADHSEAAAIASGTLGRLNDLFRN
jgi:hypothetical protein